jgi:hypothetical protein
MADVILTDDQSTQCSVQTVDLFWKTAVAGAIAYVMWEALIKEQIVGRDLPSRTARAAASRFKNMIHRSG